LIDVPEKVRNSIQFHFVSKMRDVLSIAIGT